MKTRKQYFDEKFHPHMTAKEFWELSQECFVKPDLYYPVIIHEGHGSFTVSTELVNWLVENKRWLPGELISLEPYLGLFYPKVEVDLLRLNLDLAEAVEALPEATKLKVHYLSNADSWEVEAWDGYEEIIYK